MIFTVHVDRVDGDLWILLGANCEVLSTKHPPSQTREENPSQNAESGRAIRDWCG